jgi:hypothetical protein
MWNCVLIIFIFVFCGCEKDVKFDLNSKENLLVVDATIENGQPPIVILSKSFSYFSQISPQLLANSFVHGAEVTITNNGRSHRLREYSIDTTGGYSIYFYSIDTANLSSAIIGDFNQKYDLNIKVSGKEYNSTTTIPILAKKPDTLLWSRAPFNPDTNKVVVMVRSSDPPGLGNYIRYYTKRNSGPYLPGEASVFDDQFVDGTSYELRVDPGIDRNNKIPYEDNYFRRGDTVTLKLCNIDRDTYKFWSTMEFAYQSIGNPFAAPNKVIGNVSNGALGAFCGYAASFRTIRIPK